MDQFLSNFADAVNQPDASFSADQKLGDLPNWDSLAILTTLSMIDEQYNVSLTGTDLQSCHTVGDIYSKIKEQNPDA